MLTLQAWSSGWQYCLTLCECLIIELPHRTTDSQASHSVLKLAVDTAVVRRSRTFVRSTSAILCKALML